MAFLKKRKFDEENLSFKKEWTQQYAFILPPSGSKLLCLTCNESVALVKSSNLNSIMKPSTVNLNRRISKKLKKGKTK